MKNYKKYFSNDIFKIVFFTLCSGIVIHIFGLINVLHNYDDINIQSGYGTGIYSGRWVLTVVGDFVEKIWGNYNLPYVNGTVFILLIAISAGIIFSILDLKSWKLGYLIGLLLVVYPPATSVLFFKYTAVYYGISILLAVLAVWAAEKKHSIIISTLCIAFSLGIYQAYLPLMISLFVILLIKRALENNLTFKECVFRGLYYCGCLIMGMAVYFIVLKLCLYWYDTELLDYQGVSEMGKLDISTIPGLIKKAFISFCKLPMIDYHALAQTGILKWGYFLLGAICIFLGIRIVVKEKRKLTNIFALFILSILFPIAVNFIVIMCPNGVIYTLMIYSFVAILIIPVIFLDINFSYKIHNNFNKIMGRIVTSILLIMILNYAYLSNVNYTAMYYTDRQTENYLNAMVTQIRMTEGFDTSKKWAFIGDNITDPLIYNPWGETPLYGGNNPTYINRYSRMRWIEKYFGYKVPLEEEGVIENLENNEDVKNMACWPDNGSVKVIGETIVIKLENTQ